jgi:hypothetical protein
VLIVGAGVTLNATGDESGKPLPRLTWTGLTQNGLEYLVDNGYVDVFRPKHQQSCWSTEIDLLSNQLACWL